MRAPGVRLVAQGKRPGVDEEAAVAVFRQTGQPIDISDRYSGSLHRLDERIGEPLGELVKRHELYRQF